jgi:hypothetical protein
MALLSDARIERARGLTAADFDPGARIDGVTYLRSVTGASPEGRDPAVD